LQAQGLLEKDKRYTSKHIAKEMTSLHIYQHYFHTRQHNAFDADAADAHFMHYKYDK